MNASPSSSLSPDVLARRLAELVADERATLVEFLLHLEEFDRRRLWAEAGYDSLWNYCQGVLHLREGPAGRRIGAMRIVRQFPRLADALRDGRLCLSTVTLLAPLLTEEDFDDVVARAAYKTKAEVERLVASLLPRDAPRDGIRKVPGRCVSGGEAVPARADGTDAAASAATLATVAENPSAALSAQLAATAALPLGSNAAPMGTSGALPPQAERAPSRATMTPIAADSFSLRVTIDAALKEQIEELTALISHKIPNGDLAAVLREGIRCALEKHGKRKGGRAPPQERTRSSREATEKAQTPSRGSAHRPHIPAHVRREVWKRDGGRCTWCGADGHRCESRWQLEFDHIESYALGNRGTPTARDLRLRCRVHNQLYAEQVFGAEHMARFRHRDRPGRVRLLIPGSAGPG